MESMQIFTSQMCELSISGLVNRVSMATATPSSNLLGAFSAVIEWDRHYARSSCQPARARSEKVGIDICRELWVSSKKYAGQIKFETLDEDELVLHLGQLEMVQQACQCLCGHHLYCCMSYSVCTVCDAVCEVDMSCRLEFCRKKRVIHQPLTSEHLVGMVMCLPSRRARYDTQGRLM